LLEKNIPTEEAIGRLHDAQGVEIPLQAIKDVEIRFRDLAGRNVVRWPSQIESASRLYVLATCLNVVGALMDPKKPWSTTQLMHAFHKTNL